MTTTKEVIDAWRDHLGVVPSVANDFVCNYCLGPVSNYPQCWGCKELFLSTDLPSTLYNVVVPMTSVLNPSPWYSALVGYKSLRQTVGGVLASVSYHFLTTYEEQITELLGGIATGITLVPSKRGVPYEAQPLRSALGLVDPIRLQLRQTLVHRTGEPISRRDYSPEVFLPATDVSGHRLILIEDTWVTGATAMSAAGALLRNGAESVAVFPIARVQNDKHLEPTHPYRTAMSKRYEIDDKSRWPR